jgi:hypothetical protein
MRELTALGQALRLKNSALTKLQRQAFALYFAANHPTSR